MAAADRIDRLERLTNLIALLLTARPPLTREQIFDRLGTVQYPGSTEARRQAFERDKRLLRAAGVPVQAEIVEGEAGASVYWIEPDEYFLGDMGLSDPERVALHAAAAAVRAAEWGDVALTKLGTGPEPRRVIDLDPPAAVPVVFEARRRRSTLSFGYRGEPRRVDPYGLLWRNGFWYVIGHDHGRGEQRTFRLDRIEGDVDIDAATGSFEVPEDFDARAALPADPLLVGDGPVRNARVLIDASAARRVVESLGSERVVERRPDAGVVVSLDVSNPDALRSFVLGHLDHAELLGPPEDRAALVAWLEQVP